MHRQLNDIAEGGSEPIAVLRPAEAPIYTRYGYGEATKITTVRVNARGAQMRSGARDFSGSLSYADSAAPSVVRDIYQQAWSQRIGWTERGDLEWNHRIADAAASPGRSALRTVIHRDQRGEPTGYVLFAFDKRDRSATVADVLELVALTPAAYADLWKFLLGIDAIDAVTFDGAPDEPLQYLLDDPRIATWTTVDSLAARIIDVPRALEGRGYAADMDVVLDITDELLPRNAGAFRLVVKDGTAICERTDAAADLRMPVETLGAIYFGGTPLTGLHRAGRVTERTSGAVDTASRAFAISPAPHYPGSWDFPAY